MITAIRYHDISCGHRVVGHESKCANLHGHNYRIHFHVQAPTLDDIGRVLDFSIIKSLLCQWLEENWDHKMLIWREDPMLDALLELNPDGIYIVPFNPTAENMAEYLVRTVGIKLLPDNVTLVKVVVEETRKCFAAYERQS